MSIQAQVINLLEKLQRERGFSYLFIAHDLEMVYHISHKIGVMYLGNMVELGSSDDVYKKPKLLGYKKQNQKTAQNKKNILINMSASKPNKIYPQGRMQEVIAAFEDENIIMLDGSVQMGLDEIKAIVDSCDLVIGGDTGITHMAWAMNVPSVTIFGATPHERNAFATDKNVMIGAKDGVDASKLDYDDFSIATIEPVRIIETARGLLC